MSSDTTPARWLMGSVSAQRHSASTGDSELTGGPHCGGMFSRSSSVSASTSTMSCHCVKTPEDRPYQTSRLPTSANTARKHRRRHCLSHSPTKTPLFREWSTQTKFTHSSGTHYVPDPGKHSLRHSVHPPGEQQRESEWEHVKVDNSSTLRCESLMSDPDGGVRAV